MYGIVAWGLEKSRLRTAKLVEIERNMLVRAERLGLLSRGYLCAVSEALSRSNRVLC